MHTAGVYCITNRVTGDCYVGQSRKVCQRLYSHLTAIRSGKHPISAINDLCRSHGFASFDFQVLEVLWGDRPHRTILTSREKFWMGKRSANLNLAKLDATNGLLVFPNRKSRKGIPVSK